MEQVQKPVNYLPSFDTNTSTTSGYDTKTVVIFVLCFLLLFSFLGINLLDILSNLIKLLIRIFGPLITQILSIFGYTAGTILNKSADVVSDTGKIALDIAEGTVQNVGDLMIKASKNSVNSDTQNELENALQINKTENRLKNNQMNDVSDDPIQKPISANKNGWCLVGEYNNKRGCVEVNESDKCLSGQIFPTLPLCERPTNIA